MLTNRSFPQMSVTQLYTNQSIVKTSYNNAVFLKLFFYRVSKICFFSRKKTDIVRNHSLQSFTALV